MYMDCIFNFIANVNTSIYLAYHYYISIKDFFYC